LEEIKDIPSPSLIFSFKMAAMANGCEVTPAGSSGEGNYPSWQTASTRLPTST